jgi:hypothetical protein
MTDEFVPDADAGEQDVVVDDEAPAVERVDAVGDRPEADVLEQSMVVRAEQALRSPTRRDDVPEADAWEQAIEEPLGDDERL